jgi:hypothetical protein
VSRDLLRADIPGDDPGRRLVCASVANIGKNDVPAFRQHADDTANERDGVPDGPGDHPGNASQRLDDDKHHSVEMPAAALGCRIESGRGHELSHQAQALVAPGRENPCELPFSIGAGTRKSLS